MTLKVIRFSGELYVLFKTYNDQNKKQNHNSGKPQLKRILI